MFCYCVIMLLTCSLTYRQPMETWRLRWCVSSEGVTSQATSILWLTVMQVSRKMQKKRARTHTCHLRADRRAVPKATAAHEATLQLDQPSIHAKPPAVLHRSELKLHTPHSWHSKNPPWDYLSVFQESSRKSPNSRRSPKNKNTSSNTENSSCLDSSNHYLPLTSGTY